MKQISLLSLPALLSLVACAYGEAEGCDRSLLPYQYRVSSGEEVYYVAFIKLASSKDGHEYFMMQSYVPIRDTAELYGGDPTGEHVTFLREGRSIVASGLGVALEDDGSYSNDSGAIDGDSDKGVVHFTNERADYSLIACHGLFSDEFNAQFIN